MKAAFYILAIILLAACTPVPPPVAQRPAVQPVEYALKQQEPDSCGTARAAVFYGQPAAKIAPSGFPGLYRILPVGAIVTQEYSAERVNFHLDQNGVVSNIDCG
jgi:hypothetical protein